MAKYALPADCPISLKGFKEYPKMSEETLAFSADIAYKGKVVGAVKNDGRGGCNMIYWVLLDSLGGEARKALEALLPTLPPDTFSDGELLVIDDDYFFTILADTEADKKFRAKEAKAWVKRCKENTVYRLVGDDPGKWRLSQTKAKTPLPPEVFQHHIGSKGNVEVVLNERILSDPFAFEKY